MGRGFLEYVEKVMIKEFGKRMILYKHVNNFYGCSSHFYHMLIVSLQTTVTIQDLLMKPNDFEIRYAIDVNLKHLDRTKNKTMYFPFCPEYGESCVNSSVRKIIEVDRNLH